MRRVSRGRRVLVVALRVAFFLIVVLVFVEVLDHSLNLRVLSR